MLVLNFILFQLAWFSCVIGAAKGQPWLGVMITVLTLIWHLKQTKQLQYELKILVTSLLIGAVLDQSLLSLNLIDYQDHGWNASVVPVWILALWLAFATTLNMSLAWMHKKRLISFFFGMIGGPLAYIAAERLGAVTILHQGSYVALALGWATVTPLLLFIADRTTHVKEL